MWLGILRTIQTDTHTDRDTDKNTHRHKQTRTRTKVAESPHQSTDHRQKHTQSRWLNLLPTGRGEDAGKCMGANTNKLALKSLKCRLRGPLANSFMWYVCAY